MKLKTFISIFPVVVAFVLWILVLGLDHILCLFPQFAAMSFMKPSALYMFLTTYVSFRWMPCQSWGFLRWPGLDGFLRLLVVVLLWSMFSEIRYITSNSMHPTLREHDRVIIEKVKVSTFFNLLLSSFTLMTITMFLEVWFNVNGRKLLWALSFEPYSSSEWKKIMVCIVL